MARRFLTHLDMAGNQIINASLEKAASDPVSGLFEGRMYYNTASDTIKVYDGTAWIGIGDITNVVGTTNEVDVSVVDGVATISLPDNISANAATATKLATAREIALSGDLSGSASFDGSASISINATIQPNSVTLGTDTTGDYVAGVSGSDGVSVSGTGEGASVTIANTDKGSSQNIFKTVSGDTGSVTAASNSASLTVAGGTGVSTAVSGSTLTVTNTGVTSVAGTANEVDVSASAGAVTISLPSTINADTTGNAATATTLATSRTISLGGDLSGSASFNGGSDITINAAIGANSVALGTDTTGDYVASVSAGTGISVSGTGEGAAVTVTNTGVTSVAGTANEVEVSASSGTVTIGLPNDVVIGNNLTVSGSAVIQGDFTVNGTTTYINTQDLNVEDNIITLNSGLAASVAPTLNAGIEINRGSSPDVQLRWNETSDKWQVTEDGTIYKDIVLVGDSISASVVTGLDEAAQDAVGTILTDTDTIDFTYADGTPSITADVKLKASNSYLSTASGLSVDVSSLETKLVTDSFTKKYAANVSGSATSHAVVHNLNTRDVVVNVYDNSTYDTVETDVVRTDANTVTISFATAPGASVYRVVVIG